MSPGAISHLQDSVNIAVRWTRDNDMRINTSKTKEMFICFCRDQTHHNNDLPYTIIDGATIKRVKHTKVLGVIIFSYLTWNEHVDYIISKASKRLYMMYQLKRAGVHQDDLVRIYVSVIRPILEYACPAWSTNIPQYLSDNIELVQKRALKSIFPSQHYTNILTNVKIPSLAKRWVQLCKDYFNKMKKDNNK